MKIYLPKPRIPSARPWFFALISSFFILHSAFAQISFINLTSLATNVTTSSALITIPGVCVNYTYTVVNSNNVIIGDPIPTAFGKVNSSFSYISNELVLLAQMPYQYNTNLAALLNAQSNSFVAATNALTGANAWLSAQVTLNQTHSLTVSNDLFTFLATNVFLPAGAHMNFDGGLIASDGLGNIDLTAGSTNGNVYIKNNGLAKYYFGANPANPGVSGTAYSISNNLSAHLDLSATATGYAQLVCRASLTGFPYATIYCDNAGNIEFIDALDGSLLGLNGGAGTIDITDASGLGQHLDGSGNATFDANASFIGGHAALKPDSHGAGGATLMLQASDTGRPMYLHITSTGVITATNAP